MKTVIWGWEPPQYEKLGSGAIRLFYYSVPFMETVTRVDRETGEETTEEVKRWRCEVVDIEDSAFTRMIQENPKSVECLKRILRERINAYDGSGHVNGFSIGGLETWLDKATRVGLQLRFEAELAKGLTSTVLWQNGMNFSLPLTGEGNAFDMLKAIELYASACYDNTQKHLAAVGAIESADELMVYDYTQGYPEKLTF